MLENHFDIESALLSTRKNYIQQFGNNLPMFKVARFNQLENRMTADVDAELALLVPLFE